MKKWMLVVCVVALAALASQSMASESVKGTGDSPAILANLDIVSVSPLTDSQMAQIHGQATPVTKYVMVQIKLLNKADIVPGNTTSTPSGYRYGYWGGPGWTAGGTNNLTFTGTADSMDGLFRTHDLAYAAADKLKPVPRLAKKIIADSKLWQDLVKNVNSTTIWGSIFLSTPLDNKGKQLGDVSVKWDSVIRICGNGTGGYYVKGFKSMKYSEYARREGIAAFTIPGFSHIFN
jgi:hypothetical protein